MKKFTLFFLFSLSALLAHQITAEAGKNNTYKAQFWAHGKFEDFKAQQLKGVQGYDLEGKEIATGIDYSKNASILTAKKPAILTLKFDAGYWVKGDNGYENIDPSEYKGIVFGSLKSIKYGKRFFQWSEEFLKPVGMSLEIIPLVNPLSLRAGEKLPILVLKDNQPLEGASFETSDYGDLPNKTDRFGIAHIPIKSKGLQIIAAVYGSDEILDPKVSNITIQSSISFEVK